MEMPGDYLLLLKWYFLEVNNISMHAHKLTVSGYHLGFLFTILKGTTVHLMWESLGEEHRRAAYKSHTMQLSSADTDFPAIRGRLDNVNIGSHVVTR